MKEDVQRKYLEYQVLIKQLKQIEQQFAVMEQHFVELKNLDEGLDILINTKEKEVFASLGAGIFVEGELKNTGKVLVNVGAGVIVEKDIKDAKRLVIRQMDDVQNLVLQIQDDFDNINNDVNVLRDELSKG